MAGNMPRRTRGHAPPDDDSPLYDGLGDGVERQLRLAAARPSQAVDEPDQVEVDGHVFQADVFAFDDVDANAGAGAVAAEVAEGEIGEEGVEDGVTEQEVVAGDAGDVDGEGLVDDNDQSMEVDEEETVMEEGEGEGKRGGEDGEEDEDEAEDDGREDVIEGAAVDGMMARDEDHADLRNNENVANEAASAAAAMAMAAEHEEEEEEDEEAEAVVLPARVVNPVRQAVNRGHNQASNRRNRIPVVHQQPRRRRKVLR